MKKYVVPSLVVSRYDSVAVLAVNASPRRDGMAEFLSLPSGWVVKGYWLPSGITS